MQNQTSSATPLVLDLGLFQRLVGSLGDPSQNEALSFLPDDLKGALAQFREYASNITACGRGFTERCSVNNVPKVEEALSVLGYAVYNVWRPHVNNWPVPEGAPPRQIVGKPFGQYTDADYALRVLSLAFKNYETDAQGNTPTAAKGGNIDHNPPEFIARLWATRPVAQDVVERLKRDCLTAAREG